MSTYNGCNLEGDISILKSLKFDINMVANTFKQRNERTSNFMVSVEPNIRKGNDSGIGECGAIQANCSGANGFELTATYPIAVNELLEDCVSNSAFYNQLIDGKVGIVADRWATAEGTYFYSKINPRLTDATADVTGVNIKEQIISVVEKAVENGFNMSDLIVVVSTKAYFDLLKLDIVASDCCQPIEVQNSQTGQILANKLGVKKLVHVDTNILSGGGNITSDTTVYFEVYVQDYAFFISFCDTGVILKNFDDVEYAKTRSHIVGKEFIDADYLNSEISGSPATSIADGSGFIVYEESPALPAEAPKKVTKK